MRAVPRCRKPVGDGAMRVRTVRAVMVIRAVQAALQVGLDVVARRPGPPPARIMPWLMPAAWRCASLSRPCEVLAGWVMVVLVSPRLAVIEQTRVASITGRRWPAPLGVGALHDEGHHRAAQPDCCAIASACCGCEGRPG